ncbi:M20/M25/M40 family metallo-hydrolase (plasmid) [Rhizobium sp. RCAM05350]|nr:M20/M25/M40 family metallo-hydrolase [Rhizobium sp. RCAM05350]
MPRVENGRLYGPGVYDMKGGVLMAFQEFKRGLAKPRDYPRALSLMIVPDEELGSLFSRAITEEIALAYKAALVFEPGAKNCGVISAHKGYGEYVVSTKGKSAHAGAWPHAGQSAVVELCRQILILEEITNDVIGVSSNVGLMSGGTFTNVIPEHAIARVDLRFADNEGWEHVKACVEGLAAVNPAVELKIELTVHQPPLTEQSTALMLSAVQQAGRQAGLKVHAESTGGSSDANMIAGVGVPVIDGMGPEGSGAHTPFEYIDIESYAIKANLLRTLLTGNFIN